MWISGISISSMSLNIGTLCHNITTILLDTSVFPRPPIPTRKTILIMMLHWGQHHLWLGSISYYSSIFNMCCWLDVIVKNFHSKNFEAISLLMQTHSNALYSFTGAASRFYSFNSSPLLRIDVENSPQSQKQKSSNSEVNWQINKFILNARKERVQEICLLNIV